MGEGSAIPTDPHHTPTFIQPSPQPQKTQKPRKPKRKDTQIPQSSDPSDNVADEVVHKELGDSGGPRCQETMRDIIAQTRFENVSKHSNDSLLARVGLTTRVESSGDKESLDEDASKQGRIDAIDTMKNNLLKAQVSDAGDKVSTASAVTTISAATTTTATITTVDDITLAQALKEMKSTKPKQKEIDVDHQLAERLQAQEQEELSVEEKATLFQQLLEKRRKYFAAKRAEEKRNKPPTKAQ
ncbi:hypothetical protein Tco_0255473 [Tanacetum coccineum]